MNELIKNVFAVLGISRVGCLGGGVLNCSSANDVTGVIESQSAGMAMDIVQHSLKRRYAE